MIALRHLPEGTELSDDHWNVFTALRTNLTDRGRHFPNPISKQRFAMKPPLNVNASVKSGAEAVPPFLPSLVCIYVPYVGLRVAQRRTQVVVVISNGEVNSKIRDIDAHVRERSSSQLESSSLFGETRFYYFTYVYIAISTPIETC